MPALPSRFIDINCSAAAGAGTATPALEHSACVAVFTVGEVALLKAAKPPSGLTVLLQSLTAHKFIVSSTAMFTFQSQMPGGFPLSGSQLYGSGTQADNLLSQYYAGPGSTQQLPAVPQTQGGAGDGERSVVNQPVATCVQVRLSSCHVSQSMSQLQPSAIQGCCIFLINPCWCSNISGAESANSLSQSSACLNSWLLVLLLPFACYTCQAHAWIALGKLCLVDEALAKKCVPLFVQVRKSDA